MSDSLLLEDERRIDPKEIRKLRRQGYTQFADMCERVNTLLSRLKAEREKNQWIPVSERLPVFTKTWREGINEYKGSNRVWIFDGKWGECSGCLYGSGWTDSVGSTLTSVTHWMPLPEPPAAKESHE